MLVVYCGIWQKHCHFATQALISSISTFRSSLATFHINTKRSQLLFDSVERREAIKSDSTYSGHHSRLNAVEDAFRMPNDFSESTCGDVKFILMVNVGPNLSLRSHYSRYSQCFRTLLSVTKVWYRGP